MAYNSNKGKQHSGDIQYENDATDTQIDFEDDSITLRTGNQPRLEVNNGHVSASGPMSASAFFGDGSNLTGIGGGGSMSSFILSGSNPAGATQTIADGNTLDISGGVGITTTAGATDKLTIDLDNTDVSAGSYTYTSLTVDAQGRITAASNGSAPSVTTFNGYAENRVLTAGETEGEIDGEANLTFNGSLLQVSGTVSASAAISASSFFGDGSNLTGIASGGGISWDGSTANGIATYKDADEATVESNLTFDGTMLQVSGTVSASAAISASSFFGDGSNLTGVGGGGSMSTFIVSGNAGAQQTINDGETLFVSGGVGITTAGVAGEQLTINLDNTDVSAGSYVFSSITVDAQGRLTAASNGIPAVTDYNTYGSNRLITAGGAAGHIDGEANLTFNGSLLQVSGTVSASAAISASSFFGDGSNLTGVGGGGSMSSFTITDQGSNTSTINDGDAINFANVTDETTVVVGTDEVTIGLAATAVTPGSYTNADITVNANGRITSASNGSLPVIGYNSYAENRVITAGGSAGNIDGEENLTFNGSLLQVSGTVSASAAISASSFFGDGSNLTGIGGGGISFNGSTANGLVTYGGASTADVEPNLTFNGSLLQVSGTLSASAAVSASSFYGSGAFVSSINTPATVINADHISSSLPISGSSFFGDGSNLTGLPSAAITTYNNSGANKIITSVNSNTVQGEDDLIYNSIASILSVAGQVSASLGVTGSSLRTADTVIDINHISSSLPISGSAFFGDGSNLTGIAGGGISWDGSTPNGIATYKDADEATVEPNLTFNGSLLQVSGTVSASAAISASSFFGDGSNLTGIAGGGISFNGSTVDGLVTYADASTADVQANLTFNPGTSTLSVTGQVSASLGVTGSSLRTADTVIDSTHVSSSLNISGSKFYANGVELTPGGGGIPDVVSDTSPQLGGNLDVNGNDIVSVSNGHIELDPDGSGKVIFKGNATKGAGQFVLNCENNSHGIIIKGPPHSAAASYTLTLPNNDGDADQVLKTDGAGNTSWVDQGGGISFNGSQVDGLVTYADASTADVQTSLTFNPGTSTLSVTGQVSASLGITGSEVHTNNAFVAGHLSYPNITSLGTNTGTGEIVRFGTGTTTAGKTYYLSTAGAWTEVNSAASGSSGLPLVAVAIGTAPGVQGMMTRGYYNFSTYLTGAFSPGMPIYLTGSGGVTTTRPSAPGESLRVAGHCTTTANVIYFNPSPDYLSLT